MSIRLEVGLLLNFPEHTAVSVLDSAAPPYNRPQTPNPSPNGEHILDPRQELVPAPVAPAVVAAEAIPQPHLESNRRLRDNGPYMTVKIIITTLWYETSRGPCAEARTHGRVILQRLLGRAGT